MGDPSQVAQASGAGTSRPRRSGNVGRRVRKGAIGLVLGFVVAALLVTAGMSMPVPTTTRNCAPLSAARVVAGVV